MTTPYTWRSASLKDIDLYWNDLDLRISQMQDREMAMQKMYNEETNDTMKGRMAAGIKRQQAEIARVLALQSEVEMFLIENEADGWISI